VRPREAKDSSRKRSIVQGRASSRISNQFCFNSASVKNWNDPSLVVSHLL